MENIYEKNLEAVKNRFPELYEKLLISIDKFSEQDETDSVVLDYSVKNEKIVAINKGDRIWYLNSRYAAADAAKIWAESFSDLNYKGIVILFGMSNMMYIKALLEKLGKENIVMLYEPSEALFYKALKEIDMQEELEDYRLFYFINHINFDSFRSYCKGLLEYERIDLTRISILPNYNHLYEQEIASFVDMCKIELSTLQIYKNTYLLYAAEMNDNLIDNIPYSIHTSSVDNMKTEIEKLDISGIPAIVVAAGPSLDKNIEELHQAEGKALIIAVDSSIRALLQRNIIPDLLVTTDPHKPMVLFEDERTLKIPLVVCMHTRYDIMAKHTGKKFMFSDCDFVSNIYHKFNNQITVLQTGGSVANTAFALARFLGFQTIFLMGQDLAFTNNKKHAGNVYQEKAVGEDASEQYIEIEGIDGKPILTFTNFKFYRDWFEAEIKDHPELKVINATEGGAKIHGASNMRLKDAIAEYCKKQIDFKIPIDESKDSFNDEQKLEYMQLVKDMTDKSKDLDKKFKEGIRYYHKLKELICKGRRNSGEFNRILKKIEEINRIGDSEPFMELISMYAKEEEYNITHNIYKVDKDAVLEDEGSQIADKGIAILKAYIKANERVLNRIQITMKNSIICN